MEQAQSIPPSICDVKKCRSAAQSREYRFLLSQFVGDFHFSATVLAKACIKRMVSARTDMAIPRKDL